MKFLKYMKAVMFILFFLAIIIVLLLGLYTNFGSVSYSEVFEENWNIRLPAGLNEEYTKKGPVDFQGHGSRYAVYQTSRSLVGSSLLNEASWEKNAEMERDIILVLDNIDVAKEEYPEFTNNYTWNILTNYNNKLYILYDADTSLLYLIQYMP